MGPRDFDDAITDFLSDERENFGMSSEDRESRERCQEVKEGAAEERSIGGNGATSKSHLVRQRVPGLRVRAHDDPTRFVIIPGRKGKRGETVVVLGPEQKWMAKDPPITVMSDAESDSLIDRQDLENTRGVAQRQPYSDFNRSDSNVDLSDTSQSFHKTQIAEPADVLDFSSLSPRMKLNKRRQMYHERRRMLSEQEDMRIRRFGTVQGAGRLRADLKAYAYVEKQMNIRKGSENPVVMGSIPGTEVGDYFFYRIELLLVGLHRQVQAGIDFISASKTKYYDTQGNTLPVAVSVVSVRGGGYQNKHEGETLVYTGQGSNKSHQVLVRGNLALKNSCDLGLSVRVIRGIEVMKGDAAINFDGCQVLQSPSGYIYFYDGLYDVKNYFQEVGPGGFKVWKFRLDRQQGQNPIPHIFMTVV
ncbi:hypothetical protein MPTK2_4g07760 [Marchantia polymorpha subsp. ruderalis]